MTLMSTYNSSGESGRCDARCYNAKNKNCDCCCGGKNHGIGENQAIENTSIYLKEMMKAWAEKNPKDIFKVNILQPSLFD